MQYLDNDLLNRLQESDGEVYPHDVPASCPVFTDQLIKSFPRVFAVGMGALVGEYHMVLDELARPVQHPPHRVPAVIRKRLRETLEDLEKREIIILVTTPTPWISSMVVVPKKNGKLRICLGPMDLNCALQRENYPMPTIEEVAYRLHGAKFSHRLMSPTGSGTLFLFLFCGLFNKNLKSNRKQVNH